MTLQSMTVDPHSICIGCPERGGGILFIYWSEGVDLFWNDHSAVCAI